MLNYFRLTRLRVQGITADRYGSKARQVLTSLSGNRTGSPAGGGGARRPQLAQLAGTRPVRDGVR